MSLYFNAAHPFSGARVVFATATSTAAATTQQVRLGKRWAEYQGSNNWAGLLDPLDDTLRSELLRYGKFVQATYNCFNFDPSSLSYATCRFPTHALLPLSGVPDSGYCVTRHLHASSSIQMPRWADDLMPPWVANKTSWIGYIAICQDDDEVARLGRRDVVIAYRGTVTCLEWVENLRATLTHVPSEEDVMVERGFWSLYSSTGLAHRSLRDEVNAEVERIIDLYGGRGQEPLSITITGHSLGAALATLTAYDLTTTLRPRHQPAPHVTVFSFGGPRVGNARFRRTVEERGSKVLRIVNTRDIVTKVPGFVVDDNGGDGGGAAWISKAGWAYSDIGQELKVCCESSSMTDCHDLDVYLRLVKQPMATCPFRSGSSEHGGELTSHRQQRQRRPRSFFMQAATYQ